MEQWSNFAVAEVGASAALTGLIFVGVSINLNRLIESPAVLQRAAAALAVLMGVLITSSLLLVPDQSTRALGWETLLLGLVVALFVANLGKRSLDRIEPQYRINALLTIGMRSVATVPTVIGGAMLVLGHESGVYWFVVACLSSFVVALAEAWVILVEIVR